jgi:outer membrane protein assembly factor BamB
MATPLLYRSIFYVVSTGGVVTALEPRTGKQIYQQRLAPGGYSASPVAADGRIYIASEDGQVFTIRAGPAFEILATSAMNEPTMATPALAGQTIFVRTEHWVWALADRAKSARGGPEGANQPERKR